MEAYDESTYGERIAGMYDELWDRSLDLEGPVGTLAELAGKGRALELGIGTGRIALRLAGRGVSIQGIDASPAMIARLREKSGGDAIEVAIGNFADVGVEGTFHLVFVVFNTFFALTSQAEQVRCFRNVASRLEKGGAFVIEAFVPDLSRFVRGQCTQTSRIDLDRVIIDVSEHDPVQQVVTSQHVLITEQGLRLLPVRVRYAWPSELDLMARLAGLELRCRWGGWQRQPFTAASPSHVSVYERR